MKKALYTIIILLILNYTPAFAAKPNNPNLDFKASPANVNEGDHVTITWNVPEATSCFGMGEGFDMKILPTFNPPGGFILQVYKNTKFTLTCQTPSGVVKASQQVKVKNTNKHSTSFEFVLTDPILFPKYGTEYYAALYWNAPRATSCTGEVLMADGTPSNNYPEFSQTSGIIRIAQRTANPWTYNLTCSWPNGNVVTKTVNF